MSPRPSDAMAPPQAHLTSTRPTTSAPDTAESEVLIEGQSSFIPHCGFAIGFLHNVVGSRQTAMDDGSEITSLLDALHHILDAFHLQCLSPNLLFPLAAKGPDAPQMPPLDSVFAVIYKGQGIPSPSCSFSAEALIRGEKLFVSHSLSPPSPAASVGSVLEGMFLGRLLERRVHYRQRGPALYVDPFAFAMNSRLTFQQFCKATPALYRTMNLETKSFGWRAGPILRRPFLVFLCTPRPATT